ncbi:hypothetical protein L1887_53571 [Cichorium endivia]|nr:hypothetical protein L1887_53571 [Cichorium endivia]
MCGAPCADSLKLRTAMPHEPKVKLKVTISGHRGIPKGPSSDMAGSLCRQFARSLKVAALCTFASCLVVDPRVYDGLELSAEIGALELDLLDQRRCIAVCLLVGTVPPHRVWTPFRPCALDDQTHCVGEAHGRVRCSFSASHFGKLSGSGNGILSDCLRYVTEMVDKMQDYQHILASKGLRRDDASRQGPAAPVSAAGSSALPLSYPPDVAEPTAMRPAIHAELTASLAAALFSFHFFSLSNRSTRHASVRDKYEQSGEDHFESATRDPMTQPRSSRCGEARRSEA